MPRPIITLLTDFGETNGYAAQMRGVILGLCPDAQIVDVTHAVPPFDTLVGQLYLCDVVSAFPPGTIHVAVVDPGVGTSRRPIVVAAGAMAPGHVFVGPDNGVCWPFARDGNVFELSNPRYRRPTISATFHGRDIFAPAAAHLANGVRPEAFGPPVTDPVRLAPPRVRREAGALVGELLFADSFGNLVSNICAEEIPAVGRECVRVSVAGRAIAGLSRTYGDAAPNALIALVGSSGRLEIACRNGNAAIALGIGGPRGVPVVVEGLDASTAGADASTQFW